MLLRFEDAMILFRATGQCNSTLRFFGTESVTINNAAYFFGFVSNVGEA